MKRSSSRNSSWLFCRNEPKEKKKQPLGGLSVWFKKDQNSTVKQLEGSVCGSVLREPEVPAPAASHG